MMKWSSNAQWITPEIICDPKVHKPAGSLKKVFNVKQTGSASLMITAHGIYEAYINKTRVGNFVLAPGSYNYDAHLAFQVYDVSELLIPGENEIEVLLGDGWYRSVSGVDGDRNLYGEDISLICQLQTGNEIVLVSDESWLAATDGPILENDMQQGEIVDARREFTDYHAAKQMDFSTDNLFQQASVPVVEKEHFEGKTIQTPSGKIVYDFGQNLAGYVEFDVESAEAGQQLVLRMGETLDENGEFTQENFQDRKRHKEGGTRQEVIYTCKKGYNHYKTKFSIWGFRYALLEGNVNAADIKIRAIAVYSDMEELASFECSDPDVNQLFHNCLWSMKSNFCDVPTDCPTRERAAWTGDMGVFAHTGMYLMDCYPVVRKWLEECRIAQMDDGRVPNIAPKNNTPGFFSGLLSGSVGWGDAVIIVPYELYRQTGDLKILTENYEMMTKWYGYLTDRAKALPKNLIKWVKRNPYRRYTIETGIDYGEWCEPDVESTGMMSKTQTDVATAYFAYSGKLLAEIAEIIGNKEDAKQYRSIADQAKKAYRFVALGEDGRIHTDRQAKLVRAIAFGLLEENEKKKAVEDLNQLVINGDYHLNTGFLSTPMLCPVLAENGYVDTAYRLLLQDTAPSWLYSVKKGATTIWESWDGIDENGKPKESLNHYSKGAIAGWMLDGICGIKVDVTKEHALTIAPMPYKLLPYAKAVLKTGWGQVVSSYEIKDGAIKYHIEIPQHAHALVMLPGQQKQVLASGVYDL